MMRDDRHIEFLNGRAFMALTGALLVVCALAEAGRQSVPSAAGGIYFGVPEELARSSWLSALVNLACLLGIGALMLLANKLYSFVRSMTSLFVSVFFLLEAAMPGGLGAFGAGTALCLMLALGVLALFASYEDTGSQGRIYLTMAALSAACMWQWAFVILVPAFFLGFLYLRAMRFRGFLAALLGLATPFWIVFGLGVVNPVADFHPLRVSAVWNAPDASQAGLLIGWTVAVVLLSIVLTVMNLAVILNYRLQFRVYNGFFSVVMLLGVLAVCVDYRDAPAFLPLLNLCLAVQIAQAFTLSAHPKRYIALWIFAAVALALALGALAA